MQSPPRYGTAVLWDDLNTSESSAEALTSGSVKVNLFGHGVFADTVRYKMKLYAIGVLIRREETQRQTHIEKRMSCEDRDTLREKPPRDNEGRDWSL